LKKSSNRIVLLIVIVALLALIWFGRHRIHFNWSVFLDQLHQADWTRFAIATALIWLGYGVRAMRWALFMKPTKRVHSLSILGSQVIGFTGVALFGRLADLVRPYLVSRRTDTPLASQIGIYAVERTFDMGSVALIFSTVLLFAPDRRSLPRPDLIHHAALVGLLVTVALALFATLARISGRMVAEIARRSLGALSPGLGQAASEKILAFRDGLNAIDSAGDFLLAVVFSLGMWAMIAGAYLETTRAFTASPALAGMTLSRCMLLMAASMGSSMIQLPVIGWFTQIALTAAAMQALFHAASEPALACGAMLLIVTFMSVIPVGLIWARFEHVSLKKIARESEHAGEELAHHPGPSTQGA
jgi:glycosyltransferase 2 family protein